MKIYCCSDLHGYFTEFKSALDKSGFEIGNPNHLLIICGDYFDRGREPRQLLDFLNSIPNKVLIRGNHEDLMEEMWKRGVALGHDIHNGTMQTVNDLVPAKITERKEVFEYVKNLLTPFYDQMVDYFESEHFVFTHGWIPVMAYDTDDFGNSKFRYNRKWRYGNWEQARWFNGIGMALTGANQTGKTVVVGHWHTSYGHSYANGGSEFGADACFDPFIDEEHKLIALDGCTAHSGQVNIVVLEDELLEVKS